MSHSTPASLWTWSSSWPALAKINLFLHVVGRRPDGYHLLQTVFRFVDFGDTLTFQPRQDGQVRLLNPLPGVPPELDLTVRAARLLQAETGCVRGVNIGLEKRLPMGGGLGGGSSDAATVLLALNHLWGLGLSRQRLQTLGLGLGADVPVFVFGRSAFAEGVGEALRPLNLPPTWYLILVPPVAVPTAAIFTAPDLCRDTPVLEAGDWRPGLGRNDLEPVACRLYPPVAEHLAWLRARGAAAMSGSGACVFAAYADEARARQVAAELPAGWVGWVAAGMDCHPLANLADDENK